MADFHELAAAKAIDARTALRDWRESAQPPASRPRVALNMITSVDGRVTKDGRSGGLSSSADRELFHELRAQADAVMAGANTVRIERYGPIIGDPAVCARREADGLRAQPYAVIASRSGVIDPQSPLLADPDSHVIVLGPATAELPVVAARLDHIGPVALAEGLSELRERYDIELLLCEGGPTLAGELFAAGLLDELFLTLAPRILGGPPGPTFLGSPSDSSEAPLRLAQLLRSGDELFARYLLS